MEEAIIRVQGLSKRFIIEHENRDRYVSLRDVITRKSKAIFGKGRNKPGAQLREEFWALKDINFEINRGARLGIIGRNGAGKSTLLKVLSRITEPTAGKVEIQGKVASLLEVGTGFHPELTGRENIFLNGAILGMSRAEIRSKFNDIVDFAEVEQFLDTPVKRYSSGMYVRLAFAVAAHLDPEILVVDEVLAVGDAKFQKKCLGKMESVSRSQGRTVLFVSHNLSAIKSLCDSAIILHKGKLIHHGTVNEALEQYLSFDQNELDNKNRFTRELPANGRKVFIQEIELKDDQSIDFFRLQLKIKIQSEIRTGIGINIRLKDGMGFPVAAGFTHYLVPELSPLVPGENKIEVISEKLNLAAGTYKMSVELVVPGVEVLDVVDDGIQFELTNDGLAQRGYGIVQDWGYGSMEIKFQDINVG